jgi:hypothetical protein
MKKKQLKTLKFVKSSISNLVLLKIGGKGPGTRLVCPTYAADRPGCPSFICHDQ